MVHITKEIEKLLIHRSVRDSSTPLITYCVDDLVFYDFLQAINQKYDTKNKLISYNMLAHLIFCHPSDEYEKTFTPSNFQKDFLKYIYSWNRLSFKRIPFERWSDLAEEGVELLKILINESKLENFREDTRYKDFMKRFIKRHEDLRMSGEYPDLNEFMDD